MKAQRKLKGKTDSMELDGWQEVKIPVSSKTGLLVDKAVVL